MSFSVTLIYFQDIWLLLLETQQKTRFREIIDVPHYPSDCSLHPNVLMASVLIHTLPQPTPCSKKPTHVYLYIDIIPIYTAKRIFYLLVCFTMKASKYFVHFVLYTIIIKYLIGNQYVSRIQLCCENEVSIIHLKLYVWTYLWNNCRLGNLCHSSQRAPLILPNETKTEQNKPTKNHLTRQGDIIETRSGRRKLLGELLEKDVTAA